jgi:hypothetical protein
VAGRFAVRRSDDLDFHVALKNCSEEICNGEQNPSFAKEPLILISRTPEKERVRLKRMND